MKDDFGPILIFGEQEDGKIHPVSYELLGKGRDLSDKLGTELCAVLLGQGLYEEAKELMYYGADKVFLYDDSSLRDFDVIRYKNNIVKLAEQIKPSFFLIGATRIGRSLAPRIAAALKTGLTADCVDLQIDEEGNLVQTRPAFSGNIMAQIKTKTRPQMATVRYKVMKKMEKNAERKGTVIRKEIEKMDGTGIRIIEKIPADQLNISEANVIISGGSGLKRPEDFEILEELAELLGGVVGSSRPLVDAGWISRDHQIGFSGNTVKPRIYMAFGISGAPQHLFGMRDSDIIIAVNKDASAAICDISDYLIVGDLYEVLPVLIRELKKMKQEDA